MAPATWGWPLNPKKCRRRDQKYRGECEADPRTPKNKKEVARHEEPARKSWRISSSRLVLRDAQRVFSQVKQKLPHWHPQNRKWSRQPPSSNDGQMWNDCF
ncbi:hypothetical protein ACRRTK_013543 [Alexandromys fortis]